MAKSQLVKDVDRVMSALRPELREQGFDCRGRDFSRLTQDGLTQIVNFQLSDNALKREFTVNLGVYVPEVSRHYVDRETVDFVLRISESHCHIRSRLKRSDSDRNDPWWPVGDAEGAIEDIRGRMFTYGLRFLRRFASREKIFRNLDIQHKGAPPPRIILAMMCYERGEFSRARDILTDHVNDPGCRPHHIRHVLHVAEWLGLDLAVDESSSREI